MKQLRLLLIGLVLCLVTTTAKLDEDFSFEQYDRSAFPTVESHTYEHQWLRNIIMYMFIGLTLNNCAFTGMFFSMSFQIQGWFWDCLDNARTNLTLI